MHARPPQDFPRRAGAAAAVAYLTVTVAPAPSRAALALSADSLLACSSTGLGAPSTRSLASLRPRLVRVRTSLMTWIFFSPAASRMTSNSSFSSTSSAAPAPAPLVAGPATATGAAALTSNVSSNCLTNAESSSSVISLNASSSSSLLSFAIACFLFLFCVCPRGATPLQPPAAEPKALREWTSAFLVFRACLVFRARLAAPAASLLLQRGEQPGHLGRQRRERGRRAGQRGFHRARQLGQQHLARLEIGQPDDLVRRHRLPVEHAALDHKERVRPGEVAQPLGRLDDVALDERDGRGADQQVAQLPRHARLGRGDLVERVVHHRERRVLAERPAQLAQLGHGKAAVLGQHRARRALEALGDLGDRGLFLRPRHGPPFSVRSAPQRGPPDYVRRRRRAQEVRTPRAQAHGASAADQDS